MFIVIDIISTWLYSIVIVNTGLHIKYRGIPETGKAVSMAWIKFLNQNKCIVFDNAH